MSTFAIMSGPPSGYSGARFRPVGAMGFLNMSSPMMKIALLGGGGLALGWFLSRKFSGTSLPILGGFSGGKTGRQREFARVAKICNRGPKRGRKACWRKHYRK